VTRDVTCYYMYSFCLKYTGSIPVGTISTSIGSEQIITHRPKFHLARLDSFDFVKRVETSVSSRAVPTWRTMNKL